MPSPYHDDQDKRRPVSPPVYSRHRPPQRQQYRRGDAPFQIPIWVVILTFCFGMWPVSVVLLILNYLLRTGQISSDAFRSRQRYAPTNSIYAQPAKAPAKPAPAAKAAPPKQGDGGANVLAIVGIVVAAIGLLATVSGLHDMIFYGGWEYWDLYIEDVVAGSLPLFAGIGMCIGANIMRTGRRIRRKIDKIVGDADHMYIKEIADALPCSYDKCRRYLEDCIDKGVFGDDAYLDMRTRCLIVRGDAPKPEPAPKPAAPQAPAAPQSEYDKTLARLRELNDAIPDEEMSERIARLEAVTAKIFAQAESDPDKLPQMRKFLDYYLPTSLKLLEAYAEMDAQGIEGENITESKRRIEQTMGTLVTAFENQLDKLFQSDALDLSADIDVMEKMLQADGLAGDNDPFDLRTPKTPESPKIQL
ncbi:5-bromo-4-chloroindolyl phosphate hydrolysis family protein [uncultured Gemmiger sp.]|uniref:5-bromo-4-chloroindolyl phosphate hydrolysis family protein n=1 Tax=uncultured Gemmiger sp. TaxID=1623490 RepID=UPI0025F553F3|nr:5-bromo-4-chloroindolyl phosphate hydrolysis family protein [uncultured Gemmiger sp.]